MDIILWMSMGLVGLLLGSVALLRSARRIRAGHAVVVPPQVVAPPARHYELTSVAGQEAMPSYDSRPVRDEGV